MNCKHGANRSLTLPDDLKTFLVFPYMDHDLCGLLKNPSLNMTDGLMKLYMLQLLDGVAYMHDVSMMKPAWAPNLTSCPLAIEQHRSPRLEIRKYPSQQ